MFHVGQPVECIDDKWLFFEGPEGVIYPKDLPVKGGSYHISGFSPPDIFGPEQIYLREFSTPEPSYSDLVSFAKERFRPLTDTSIATVLAQKAPRDSRKWDNRKKQKERA